MPVNCCLSRVQVLAIVCSVFVVAPPLVRAQFWKMNSPSNKDLFILETKSSMPSGICYKQVLGKASDPTLNMQTISYCCDGYRRNSRSTAMQCDPICTEDCTNGICTAPDVCECYPGYTRMGGRCEEW